MCGQRGSCGACLAGRKTQTALRNLEETQHQGSGRLQLLRHHGDLRGKPVGVHRVGAL